MNACPKIQFRLAPRAKLSSTEKSEMFCLLSNHFSGVTPEQFAQDLAEKDLAILLESDAGLVGFSTLMAYNTTFNGEQINVIYSGDTIVAPNAWGTMALPRAWVSGVDTLRCSLPAGRCFWLLLTSGFRTYRFLPVFWRVFHPCFESPASPATQRMLNELAEQRFGKQFDRKSGIVRFNQPQRLRSGLREVRPERTSDPHVAFFLSRNPGYDNGDELVCLTELSPDNLTAAGRRMTNPQSRVLDHAHR
jgi:hypothetical protein